MDPEPPSPPAESSPEAPSETIPQSPSSEYSTKKEAKPHVTLFRLGLAPLIIHFKSSSYISAALLSTNDSKILARTLTATARRPAVRAELGADLPTWLDLTAALRAAVPSLSARCFAGGAAPQADSSTPSLADSSGDAASARTIAAHHASLVADLRRLGALCGVARNVLAGGAAAQGAAARAGFDAALFEVLRLCVRVTARPYGAVYDGGGVDGGGPVDAARADEARFNAVGAEFKVLLTRCLQVLNNLVAQNERRKLMVWVELFDERGAEGLVEREIDAVARIVPALNAAEREDVRSVNQSLNQVLEGKRKRGEQEIVEGDQPLALDAWNEEGPANHYPQPAHMLSLGKVLRNDKYEDEDIQIKPSRALHELKDDFEELDDDEEHRSNSNEVDEVLKSSPYLSWLKENSETVKKEFNANGTITIPSEFDDERQSRLESNSDENFAWWKQYGRILGTIDEGLLPPGEDIEALRSKGIEVGILNTLPRKTRKRKPPEAADAERRLSIELEGLKISKEFESSDPAYKHFAPTWSSQVADGDDAFDAHIAFGGSKETLPEPATEEDYRPTYSAAHGASILERGKADLLKRLEPDTDRSYRGRQTERHGPASDASGAQSSANTGHNSPTIPSDVVEAVSDEESDEDDYPVPGDDGRGLLTDIPLILGPSEIEVLPMIIQSAICPPLPGTPGYGKTPQEIAAVKNMHTVRCHLLLAQDNGRNLLRELLIFVAAWDLREDELYFKLMVKIMESILLNGLMPFAYRAFRESKDIISPAQAVVLKLLTSIFRQRQSAHSPRRASQKDQAEDANTEDPYPQRVDVQTVSFLLTEFRRTIIPQTCVLIFLQGKIRDGTVSPEDFPLNLWDMERMYEGVYQYLEFFAILTEHEGWKGMMADWEVVSELVSLLEELDAAIPRSTPASLATQQQQRELIQKQSEALRSAAAKAAPDTPKAATSAPPIAVERPYDLRDSSGGAPVEARSSAAAPPPLPHHEDEPSDFEWRNLKKLAVLVVSSLTWKSARIQAQLGAADGGGVPGRGLRALLACCAPDDFNPFIREHGIMALRFALEGNEEGMAIVRNLVGERVDAGEAARSAEGGAGAAAAGKTFEVPREVLDLRGYETFVDARGQVQLKRKEKK